MSNARYWRPRPFWARGRVVLASLLALGLAGVFLASCTTGSAPSATPIVGLPSIGISVPLQRVACTLGDACVALGATSASVGPSTVAEYRTASSHWLALATPSSPEAQFSATSCWNSDCLIGGAQASGDLLWDYHGSNHSLTALRAPAGGVDLGSLNCFGPARCVALDYDARGDVRLSSSLDGGNTWSAPLVLAWAQGDTIGALACHSTNDCLVGVNTSAGAVVLKVTHDAGVTWTTLDATTSWSSLRALTCRARSCVALVDVQGATQLRRSRTFGQSWRGVNVSGGASALACTSYRHCVLIGKNTTGAPWLAQVSGNVVSARVLRYVPSALVDVACGTNTCAAVAVTTVLAFAP